MDRYSRFLGATPEYVIKCMKPDRSLIVTYVRISDSMDDMETEARLLMTICDCEQAELWRGERLLCRFVKPVAKPLCLACA